MSDTQKGGHNSSTLPSGFFENLTEKQRATLKVLSNAEGEYVRGVDIRQQMREHYGVSVAHHPGGTAGVLAGFTRRYTEPFRRELIPGRWVEENNAHAEFKLGEKYEDEIRRNL